MAKTQMNRQLLRDDVLRSRGDNAYLLDLLRDVLDAIETRLDVSSLSASDRHLLNLCDEIESLVRPLPTKKHIVWSDKAICHFTVVPVKEWPAELTSVDLREFVKVLRDDDRRLKGFAQVPKDWGDVNCNDCRIRLPTLIQEVNELNFGEAAVAGMRAAFDKEPT